ncbi:hypothetical protein ACTFIZ_003403 [Dictyostelium cf. discoideum]
MNQEELEKCIDAAQNSQQYAHCPYSHFRIGAALLTSCGKIFTGVNVENSSYGLTICAERTAYTKAVSEGYKSFKGIVVASDLKDRFITPCGACRQFGVEFGDFEVVCVKPDRSTFKSSTHKLLPGLFSQEDLIAKAEQDEREGNKVQN